ncbi:hypothetical protein [Tepidibacter sp. Z1-5]|uniref:hypothetical protein n=1 Tax=Tepidibacter sp. Z1-5 TaxID=3134138 RepID=UPI0030BC0C15
MNFKFDYNNISSYIGFWGSIFTIADIAIREAKKSIKSYKVNEIDVFDFFDSVLKKELNLGDTVSVEGFFLNYGQINKPYTYINSVWRPSDQKTMDHFNLKHKSTRHQLREKEILFERNPIIVPAQRIPEINNISYGFLYDERFTGFIRNNMPDNIEKTGNVLVKDEFCNPILVIYDNHTYPYIVNKYLYIKKAKIIRGPELVNNYLKDLVDPKEDIGLSNIYRPLKFDNDIICISLLNEDTDVKIIEDAKIKLGNDFKIPLFAEGTYNLLYDKSLDTIIDIIGTLAPNDMKYLNQLPSFRDEIDKAVSFMSVNQTNITFREPGTIGFYSEVSYFDQQQFEKDFMDYNQLIKNFSIDFKNFSQKNYGIKEKFNMTFIYDYTYKNMFKSKYIDTSFKYVKEQEKIYDKYANEINKLI